MQTAFYIILILRHSIAIPTTVVNISATYTFPINSGTLLF